MGDVRQHLAVFKGYLPPPVQDVRLEEVRQFPTTPISPPSPDDATSQLLPRSTGTNPQLRREPLAAESSKVHSC